MQKNIFLKAVLILAVIGASCWYAFPLGKRIKLGLDLKGGMHLVLRVDMSNLTKEQKKEAPERALEKIRNRIDLFGVSEPSIHLQGENQIVVQLPGLTDREAALKLIGETALLEFKLVNTNMQEFSEALKGNIPEGYELRRVDKTQENVLLEKEAVLTGSTLVGANVGFDQSSFGEPYVNIEFNSEGAKKFADITTNNVGGRLAIVLDDKVLSAPRINEPIPSGKGVISGRFSPDEAKGLAIKLKTGALPAPIIIEEERTIGPLLGRDSVNKGISATIFGAVCVFLFMAVYYLLPGIIANIALVLNLLLILAGLGIFGATLTLPGIAGIVLTLGMAVDANVLINERIKEELRLGRPLRMAITNGYGKAFNAIFDSNITTLIAAFLLFQFGTGPIRGFAVTLSIGLLASMFTAVVVTRVIFELLLLNKAIKKLPMFGLIKDTKIDFIAKRKIFFTLSIFTVVLGLFIFFSKGQEMYGIDFAGGQIQEYRMDPVPAVEDIRNSLKEAGLSGSIIQRAKENMQDKAQKLVIIRTHEDAAASVEKNLKNSFPASKIDALRIEHVGPLVGKQLKDKALLALFYSLAGILLYIGFRFKHFDFAFAGIVALFHDVLVTIGFLALTSRTVDLLIVSALLTIAGYSINDTIVIYDRIRELMRFNRKVKLRDAINLAVNQTLTRTVLTTVLTLFVVISLFIFGGEILNDFAFSLLVGFISGIYSTIFIASPLILVLQRRRR